MDRKCWNLINLRPSTEAKARSTFACKPEHAAASSSSYSRKQVNSLFLTLNFQSWLYVLVAQKIIQQMSQSNEWTPLHSTRGKYQILPFRNPSLGIIFHCKTRLTSWQLSILSNYQLQNSSERKEGKTPNTSCVWNTYGLISHQAQLRYEPQILKFPHLDLDSRIDRLGTEVF
jgi:hypothetical protein